MTRRKILIGIKFSRRLRSGRKARTETRGSTLNNPLTARWFESYSPLTVNLGRRHMNHGRRACCKREEIAVLGNQLVEAIYEKRLRTQDTRA